jgi:hypothetical protein
MPGILRRLLGFIVLVATIGLATCQSMVKAEPFDSNYFAGAFLTSHSQAE